MNRKSIKSSCNLSNTIALYTIVSKCDNVSFLSKNGSAFGVIGCVQIHRNEIVQQLGTEDNQYWENQVRWMLTGIDASLAFKYFKNTTRFPYKVRSTLHVFFLNIFFSASLCYILSLWLHSVYITLSSWQYWCVTIRNVPDR